MNLDRIQDIEVISSIISMKSVGVMMDLLAVTNVIEDRAHTTFRVVTPSGIVYSGDSFKQALTKFNAHYDALTLL